LVINNPGVVAANMNVRPSALLGLFGAINGNVVNAGFFQGTGVVNGNVTNRGIVSPGGVVLEEGVVLEGKQGSFAEFASIFCGTPNAVAVGRALDTAIGDPRASDLIGFLNDQPLTDLCEDIN
jgi:hypothetical protein